MRLTSQIASLDRRSENFREDPAQSEIALLSHHEPNFLQAGLEIGFEVDGQFSSQKKIDRSRLPSRKTTCTKHNDPFADEGLRLRCCT